MLQSDFKLGKACENCVYRDRKGPLVGVGDPEKAKVIYIGDAPVEGEGVVFGGNEGRELWKLAGAGGSFRGMVFVTNVVKCCPPVDHRVDPKAVESCKEFLKKEIEGCRTTVVVTLGDLATQTLVGISGILKLRGAIYKRRLSI